MNATLDGIRDIKLYQPVDGYRFSVDSLLLYDFVRLRSVRTIADLGAGCGIIGILLAGKFRAANVTLFEIQENLSSLAGKNIKINHLGERVTVVHRDIRDLVQHRAEFSFDLVVSNPPFRKLRTGRLNITEERSIARHEITLNLQECVNAAASIVKVKGRFCMIYHPGRLAELIDVLRRKRMEPKRLRFVHSTEGTEARMVLIEAVKDARTGLKVERPLFIYKREGGYTQEMADIYDANLPAEISE